MILRLIIRKARAEFVIGALLHRELRRFVKVPLGCDLDQLAGHLADPVLEFSLASLPAAATEPVKVDIGAIRAIAL